MSTLLNNRHGLSYMIVTQALVNWQDTIKDRVSLAGAKQRNPQASSSHKLGPGAAFTPFKPSLDCTSSTWFAVYTPDQAEMGQSIVREDGLTVLLASVTR